MAIECGSKNVKTIESKLYKLNPFKIRLIEPDVKMRLLAVVGIENRKKIENQVKLSKHR